MIDMVFLLLIFTLVTAKMSSDMVVELDPPSSSQALDQGAIAVHVAVDRHGAIHLGNKMVGHYAQAAIAQALAQSNAERVIIHPDSATSTKDLLHAMDMSKEAGAAYVDLAAIPAR